MSEEWVVEVEGLYKRFGPVRALRGVGFRVARGSVFGFIGPNGAGKTTTLRILGTLLEPDGGTARIEGVDVLEKPYEVRRTIGFMPENYGIYPDITVREFLEFFARAYGLRGRRLKNALSEGS